MFSKLEYYNFLEVECDLNVVSFYEQPCKIEMTENGKLRHAVFDMWVRYRDGRAEMREIKYSKELTGTDGQGAFGGGRKVLLELNKIKFLFNVGCGYELKLFI